MYFSSKPELQGDYQEEVQTLDYDVHISHELELSEPTYQDAGELDLSGITLEQSGDEHQKLVMNTTKVVMNTQKLKLWLHLCPNPSHHRQLINQTNRLLRMFLI